MAEWGIAAAKWFFCRVPNQHGAPRVIALDSYAASHRVVAKLKVAGRLSPRVYNYPFQRL
jgi:transposase-like protein